ncbi:MAG: tungstate ABC transporter substrate-binding protein WtpA [Candidatus Wallbacteria bacterium]|nr:tungstate ABC transporter substrate-binding protein WtpA [Candidatus Wallbacteria bacterium]
MSKSTIFALLILIIGCFGCGSKDRVVIFHAGSLARPLRELKTEFEATHPGCEVVLEAAGSRASCRKISELSRSADMIAVSDYLVIEELLMPEHCDWHISFAGNSMVIAFSVHSKYGSEISPDNWFEVLARPDVKFGHSDKNLDPCGYRTEMVWQLSDRHYSGKQVLAEMKKRSDPRNVRPTEIELIALLENFALDYAFQYKSIALQYHLKYIELPESVNLSESAMEYLYRSAEVIVSGRQPGEHTLVHGTPIRYAFTILKKSPGREQAVQFAEFMLSDAGRALIEKNHQPAISPAVASRMDLIPTTLRRYCREEHL